MLPIATLPAAALMVRLGQPDMLGRDSFPAFLNKIAEFMAAGGGALLDNMPLLFAVGIAIGFAKKADGSTGLAAVVGTWSSARCWRRSATTAPEDRQGGGRR